MHSRLARADLPTVAPPLLRPDALRPVPHGIGPGRVPPAALRPSRSQPCPGLCGTRGDAGARARAAGRSASTPHRPQRGRPQHGGGAERTGASQAAMVVVGASAIDHILPFTYREIALAKEGVQGLSPSLPCGARLT
jgi:hypothetical protein